MDENCAKILQDVDGIFRRIGRREDPLYATLLRKEWMQNIVDSLLSPTMANMPAAIQAFWEAIRGELPQCSNASYVSIRNVPPSGATWITSRGGVSSSPMVATSLLTKRGSAIRSSACFDRSPGATNTKALLSSQPSQQRVNLADHIATDTAAKSETVPLTSWQLVDFSTLDQPSNPVSTGAPVQASRESTHSLATAGLGMAALELPEQSAVATAGSITTPLDYGDTTDRACVTAAQQALLR